MRDARILIVDDEAHQRELLGGSLRAQGYQIAEADDGTTAVDYVRSHPVDLVLLDQRMPKLGGAEAIDALRRVDPDLDIVVVTAFGSVGRAVEAMQRGAIDYLTKPVDLEGLEMVVRRALERRVLIRENEALRSRLSGGPRFEGIVGSSRTMQDVLSVVARAAPTDATVLITGESGTGKELIARALHGASKRATGPFVAVHCAALASGLLESELFGHEKGAFTGAYQRRLGRFEAAAGGTLFLDEVVDIPPEAQVKLLRVLQERRIERVGSNTPRRLDLRLIAATNRDPLGEVREGRFREDLFYRLAVVPLYLPPLRHRREDIPRLVEHFLKKHEHLGTSSVSGISREGMHALVQYDFPGNVRELENIVQNAVVLSRGSVLELDDLPAAVRAECESDDDVDPGALRSQVGALESRLIRDALAANDGVQCRAAQQLGISERTLRYKIEKYGIRMSTRPAPGTVDVPA